MSQKIYTLKTGDKFKFEGSIVETFKNVKYRTFVLSNLKYSAPRLFIQVLDCSNGKSSTFKLMDSNVDVEYLAASDILTLSSFMKKFRFESRKAIEVIVKGVKYQITLILWEWNATNIHSHGLSDYGNKMSIPTSWQVQSFIFSDGEIVNC